MPQPVFRFAPSPNGRLHLGHAYSALLNQKMAHACGGKLLLRIEDTDLTRCTPVLEQRMLEDLHWLGIEWDEKPRRQSDHIETYSAAIEALQEQGLAYPSFMSRSEIRACIESLEEGGKPWPHDPDGAPLYPGKERNLSATDCQARISAGEAFAIRLNMEAALEFCKTHHATRLCWDEEGAGPNGETGRVTAEPAKWGDIVLSRKDAPASYHLASVVDDALQGISHVVRGRDLFWSTSVHRLLQTLLGYPDPVYFHHDLILDEDGRKLSKSRNDTAIAELKSAGLTRADITRMVGL